MTFYSLLYSLCNLSHKNQLHEIDPICLKFYLHNFFSLRSKHFIAVTKKRICLRPCVEQLIAFYRFFNLERLNISVPSITMSLSDSVFSYLLISIKIWTYLTNFIKSLLNQHIIKILLTCNCFGLFHNCFTYVYKISSNFKNECVFVTNIQQNQIFIVCPSDMQVNEF